MKKFPKGLSRDLILQISAEKNEPAWMKEHRLQCFDSFLMQKMPSIDADLSGLDLSNLELYINSRHRTVNSWDEIPPEIRSDFEILGIPEAEQKSLSGVGLQYDSKLVYENLKNAFAEVGIVFMGIEEAIKNPEYADIIRKHFMKLVRPEAYKFAALHGAVWSGGVFIYVPKGVIATLPLQAYYRFNAPGAGQFEHSIIVVDEDASLDFIEGCSAPKYNVANLHIGCVEFFIKKGAHFKYSSVVNWSKNMYNLTTKCLHAEEGASIEWVSGVFGCRTSLLCPKIILEKNAKLDYIGITMSGADQDQNTGVRVEFRGDNCSSHIISKSISQNGGKNVFRSFIKNLPNARGCTSFMNCDSLLLDSYSNVDAFPNYDTDSGVEVSHEAKVGKISEEKINFLRARGLSEKQAQGLIVRGFIDDVSRELPLEYAQEMNKLIRVEVER